MPRKKIDLSTSGKGTVINMKTGQLVDKPVLPVICERIRHFRELRGLEQKYLAEKMGITGNAVSNWENGRARPDVNLLPALCDVLQISFYDLFDMKNPSLPCSVNQQQLVDRYGRLSAGHRRAVDNLIDTLARVEAAESCPDLVVLTYYDRRLSAGIGDPTEFDEAGEAVYVYSSPEVRRADCIFTVNGDSMEPEFHNGQDVLIERIPSGPDLRNGEIGAFIVGNETYIKELREDGLHSLNPEYPAMHFGEWNDVFLIGRVLGVLDKSQYAKPEDVEKYELVHEDN